MCKRKRLMGVAMKRVLLLLLLAALVFSNISTGFVVEAGVDDWVTPGYVLDVSPHLWYRMGEVLIDRLYNASLGLFKETWGTQEGKCWYWNTEQGEAAQIAVFLNRGDILSSMLSSYRQYLTFEDNGLVYLFSRYTPCKMVRVLSTDPVDFSVGNLIVNVGGDLAGNRTDSADYSRIIALSLDIYKDYSNVYEQDKAWPNLWYTANLRSPEVWYLTPKDTSDYKGIWDTSDGSLGAGRIVDYGITHNSTYADAYRVMSDGRLVYEQHFIVEAGKPYVRVLLVVRNNASVNLSNVRVTLALDNLDWWLYQVVYVPGIGYINASTNGTVIGNGSEKEYHFAYSWEGMWERLVDSQGRSWWPSIIYANRPIGMNRALLVLVNASYGLHFWGYGNLQSPQKDLYGVPAFTDWYYRWLKYEIQIGDLEPNESRTVEVLIIPFASYAPGLEDVILDMAKNMSSLEGRDWSFAVNTGTGAFKGLAMSRILLAYLHEGDYKFAQEIIDTVGRVFGAWGWRVTTRALSNYILALVYLYDYTRNDTYLSTAEDAASKLLSVQVRNASDPRDGGFLDIMHPYGVATYLDVNAEAAHALLELYDRTGNETYKEVVDYLMTHWFHKDSSGRWYYYRYASLQDAPSEYWYKGYLDEKQPYAQGYFLQALAKDYWSDERLLVSANRVWSLLSDELWELTWEGANETNVETQSSTAAGLMDYLYSMVRNIGVGVEYVRGCVLVNLTYEEYGSEIIGGIKWRDSVLRGSVSKPESAPATVALYFPYGDVQLVHVGGSPVGNVSNLTDLLNVGVDAYYWDSQSRILYLRLYTGGSFSVVYRWASGNGSMIWAPDVPGYDVEPAPNWSVPGANITVPTWLEEYKDELAVATVVLVLLLASEANAPVFAAAAAGLAAGFTAMGWLSLPQGVLGLIMAGVGLGLVGMRKRS